MSFWKRTKTLCENGYGVEPTADGLTDVFSAYPHDERARILNDFDADLESEGGFGDSPREVAKNLGLRARLEARHQALRKAGR